MDIGKTSISKINNVGKKNPQILSNVEDTSTGVKNIGAVKNIKKIDKGVKKSIDKSKESIVKNIKKTKITIDESNITFKEKFIKGMTGFIDLSKNKFQDLKDITNKGLETRTGKVVVGTAKVSRKLAKPVLKIGAKYPIKTGIALFVVYSGMGQIDINSDIDGSNYKKADISSTYISQLIKNESITKSLAADENVLGKSVNSVGVKKETNYFLKDNGKGGYNVYSNKLLNSVFINKLAEQKGISASDIKFTLVTPQETFEGAVISKSKSPEKMKTFLEKVSKNGVEKVFDDNLNSMMKYTIDKDDMVTYDDQIKELSQYYMFNMVIKQ